MIIDGLILVLITLFISVAIIVCNKWIRKVTNSYFFWLALGAFWLIWLLIFRFIPDWKIYIDQAKQGFDNPGDYNQSLIISRAFLLDVCPFAAFFLCVLLIVDPSRKIARSFAPIALIGGVITIFSLTFDDMIGASLTAQFIFFGDSPNTCYFIMHFIQIVLSIGIMVNTPTNGWKGYLLTFVIFILIYSYVAIVMACTGCRWNCSGLSVNDWAEGEYAMAREMFNLPADKAIYFALPGFFLVGTGIIVLKDYVFSRGHFSYGNAFSGKWYYWYNYRKFVPQRWL